LLNHDFEVIAFGQKKGTINAVKIENQWNPSWEVDTVTLYLNPTNQIPYYQPIIDLKPIRVVFNFLLFKIQR
jgi:hypothetical protein